MTLTYSVVKSEKLSVLTFNCYGLKSSINYVTDMMKALDIAFLCEHWLIESEIVRMCDEVSKPYCVHMKSSMTSEDLTTTGRQCVGVGFVCVNRRHDSLMTKSSAIQTV